MPSPSKAPVVLAPLLAAFAVGGIVLALGLVLHDGITPAPNTTPKVEAVGRLRLVSPPVRVTPTESSPAADLAVVVPDPAVASVAPLAEFPTMIPSVIPTPSDTFMTVTATPSASPTPTEPVATVPPRPTQSGAPSSVPVTPVNQATPGPDPAFVSSIVIKQVDLGQGDLTGMLAPVLGGTAKPNAQILISNGVAEHVVVQADTKGRWSAGPLSGFQAGAGRIDLRAEDEVAVISLPIELTVPKTQVTPSNTGFFLSIIGPGGCSVEVLIDGERWGQPITLQPNGNWGESLGEMSLGYHDVMVRVIAGDRAGPGITTRVRTLPHS